nr:MAG TPA: hypothetical protein [Caudoviricetes sp.]
MGSHRDKGKPWQLLNFSKSNEETERNRQSETREYHRQVL